MPHAMLFMMFARMISFEFVMMVTMHFHNWMVDASYNVWHFTYIKYLPFYTFYCLAVEEMHIYLM